MKGRTHKGTKYNLKPEALDILLPKWKTKQPDTSVLEQLLIEEPRASYKLAGEIWANLQRLKKKSRPSLKTIEILFNYDGVFNGNNGKETAYWLAGTTGRNTCTYCNRQYIFTIESCDEKGETRMIARPQFDHWFPKSAYPLLSLNLYNLIPSCSICNSSVKGATNMSLDTHIHPYVNEPDSSAFSFRVTKAATDTSEWKLCIDRVRGSKIDKTITDLALEEAYALHEPLEVKDIMDFHDAYPDGYVSSLLDDLFKNSIGNLTKSDVYRILFGAEPDPDRFLDRPLSKLKSDLLKQIGVKL
ncbi:MAG: hypothetical protein Q4C34_01450 [Bacteroidales bacterium]|nr:hypothetical protein [Bacteroidales bacterium]